MSTTEDDLRNFTQFVLDHITDADDDSRLPELFDLWLLQNPRPDEYADNVAAINASIDDYLNGERGTPAGQHSRQLRQEFGFTDE